MLCIVCCAVLCHSGLAKAHPDEFACFFAHRSACALHGTVSATWLGSGIAHLENWWVKRRDSPPRLLSSRFLSEKKIAARAGANLLVHIPPYFRFRSLVRCLWSFAARASSISWASCGGSAVSLGESPIKNQRHCREARR